MSPRSLGACPPRTQFSCWPRATWGLGFTRRSVMATQAETAPVPRTSGMNRKTLEALTGYLYVAPWIISSIVFTFGAMVYVFYLSFTDLQILNTPQLIGLDNYINVLTDPLFHTAVFNTLLYAAVVTFFQTWLALILAVVLNAKLRGKQFF